MAIENIDALEKFVTLPEGKKLSDLLESEEKHEIKLNDTLKIFGEDEHKTLIDNHRGEAETAGKEKLLKEMRDASELQYDGVKDPKKFVEALTSKIKTSTLEEAKIVPDKKIEELNGDLEKLRTQLGDKDTKLGEWENKWNSSQQDSKIDSFIMQSIPDKTNISKNEILTLARNADFKLKFDGEKPTIEKNGEVVKNDLREPVDALEYLKGFTSKFAIKPEGGTGGGDDTTAGSGSYDKFVKEMKDDGKNEGGEEFTRELRKRITDGTVKM